jgi:hypothetical protein
MLLLLSLLERGPHEASVLDLDWELSENREEPVITFRKGLGENATKLGSATSSELGLPINLEAVRRGFQGFPVLPKHLSASLSNALGDNTFPLHIHFQRRDGYLAMVHWEALLRPIVNERRRIRRLPYYSLPSVACTPNDLALIIDPTLTQLTPRLHRVIGDVMSSFSMGNGNISYLIASKPLMASVQGLNDIKQPMKLRAYDFPQVQLNLPPESPEKTAVMVEHAYLRWVSESLGPHPVNSVVFVCQGGIDFNEGVVHFPFNTNMDATAFPFSKSIAAEEMTTFLMHLGASACAFVDPNPTGLSRAGLRLLADKVAQNRPGLTAAFEPDESQGIHDFFFDVGLWPPWFVFPSSGGYLSSEFPWLEMAGDRIIAAFEKFTLLSDLVSEYAKYRDVPPGGITHVWQLPKEPVPRWLVAVQRYFEMWAARLLEDRDDTNVRLAIEEKLTSIRDSVRGYLNSTGGDAKL